ncbi:MAG: hypothetical protein VYD19_03960, partial [Myxococcota bacterium]|nr:hypothetical protein [Myxococcota bacterium]
MKAHVHLSPHALLTLTLTLPSLVACDQAERGADSPALTADLQIAPPRPPIDADAGEADQARSTPERGRADPDRAPRDQRSPQPADYTLDRGGLHDRGDLGARPLDGGAAADATRDAAPP